MIKIVIVTKGTYGDVVPFLALGAALRARGNEVVFVSQCRYERAAHTAGLVFDAWDTKDQYQAFIHDGAMLDTPHGMREFADAHIFPQLNREYEVIAKHCEAPHTVVLTRHIGSFAACFLAEQRNLPLASVFITPSQADCFPLYVQLCKDVLGQQLNGYRRHLGLHAISNWKAWIHQPDCFLGCWPNWFASPSQDWPAQLLNLGLLRSDAIETGELPPEVKLLIETGKSSPILITGGTAFWKLAPRFYEIAAEACHVAGREAILVCPHDELVPSTLPPHISRFRLLPFAALTPHVAAVIHHGGASMLVHTLAAGVPQLVMPYGADRPDNARRVQRLGAGIHVSPARWNSNLIASLLDEMISSNSIRKTCKHLSEVAARCDGSELRVGCEAIERLSARYHIRLS